MKTLIFAVALFLAGTVHADEPMQHPVVVELGPKAYRDGDVVQIDSILSTSPRLEQGDTVTVKGRVRLGSTSSARLCLYLTQTEGDGLEETDADQVVSVDRGTSKFELAITVKHRGLLHITLYDETTGKPFGGVYFGTKQQMKSLSQASVKHYLKN